jgi:hypothetical protein
MTTIEQRLLVHAPLASAQRFLDAYFAAHLDEQGDAGRITLRAGEMTRDATVTLAPAHRPEDMTPRMSVHWRDAYDGPYPHFHGTISVAGDEDYSAFWLVLDGEYAPPGGLGGQLFDAVIGNRIADITARGLLEEIRADTERRFNAEEAHKTHAN